MGQPGQQGPPGQNGQPGQQGQQGATGPPGQLGTFMLLRINQCSVQIHFLMEKHN